MAKSQPRFSSRFTTLLAMAGLAIGLGNVWRFPYMMGQHGGSAFLLVYAAFMLLLAAPAFAAELSLGRATRSGPVAAFQSAFGKRWGGLAGLLALSAAFVATCYYSVVIANVFYSAGFAARTGFSANTLEAYGTGLGNNGLQLWIALGVVLACAAVVHRGLRRGIETANKILMPLFGLATVYLVFVALQLDGAMEQLRAFLQPDFSRTGPDIWFAAMGQACFSVGLSGTLGVMYGSYLARDTRIVTTAAATCAVDLGAAFLAALFIVPAVLVFGLDLAAGPGLLFDTVPRLFAAMPGGRWLAPVFLAGWGLVAMLTLIAALDTVSGALADFTPGFGKRRWLWIVTGFAGACIVPIGLNPHWIGVLDLVFGSGMFMFGALLAVLALGWGLGAATAHRELATGLPEALGRGIGIWVRFIVPGSLAAILIGFVISSVSS
ncbi:MAG: sodium-dependent transporter [Xanthomonadales bacterium]|jgi:NSS family neurotransmitter:Na+ symporter|nr:sodium-dependent transporter [Xanthomonadales bacterium]